MFVAVAIPFVVAAITTSAAVIVADFTVGWAAQHRA